MRLGSFIAFALTASLGLSGCESAHIKDTYLSLDGEGHRLTDCIRPTKLDGVSGNHYWVFVELFAFKEDTLLTPILRDLPTGQILPLTGEDSDELVEYGNIAPGKGEHLISWEVLGKEMQPSGHEPLVEGIYVWEFYLDDHSAPDDRIEFVISQQCP